MEAELYEQYLALKLRRKKTEAQEKLAEFVASFQSHEEREQWVREFLDGSEGTPKVPLPVSDLHKMPRLVYENLVFPVLREGYRQKDVWSTLWLARTLTNLRGLDALHAEIGWKGEYQLLKEAYLLEPSPQVGQFLLNYDLRWFQHCEHEWPSGILYGMDGASMPECEEILQEVAFARSLDVIDHHEAFLTAFEEKVREYQNRLYTD